MQRAQVWQERSRQGKLGATALQVGDVIMFRSDIKIFSLIGRVSC